MEHPVLIPKDRTPLSITVSKVYHPTHPHAKADSSFEPSGRMVLNTGGKRGRKRSRPFKVEIMPKYGDN
jgi:hypothetical protein